MQAEDAPAKSKFRLAQFRRGAKIKLDFFAEQPRLQYVIDLLYTFSMLLVWGLHFCGCGVGKGLLLHPMSNSDAVLPLSLTPKTLIDAELLNETLRPIVCFG